MRIGAHATMPGRREHRPFLAEFAVAIEQFPRSIALHPFFKLGEVPGIREIGDWHLMRPPSTLYRLAVNGFRAGPALRRAKYDERPTRPLDLLVRIRPAGCTLKIPDCGKSPIERLR